MKSRVLECNPRTGLRGWVPDIIFLCLVRSPYWSPLKDGVQNICWPARVSASLILLAFVDMKASYYIRCTLVCFGAGRLAVADQI